jgi:hypothetical protein
MPRKKADASAPATMNAAPGYGAPAPSQGYGTPAPAQGSAQNAYLGGYGASANGSNGGPAAFTPPPARAPQNPFINAQFLWTFQRPIKATIKGMRDATGTGNTQFQRPGQVKRGWYFDLVLENNTEATARINEGDVRHQKLWAAYQGNIVGKTVVLRLSNPGDIDPLSGRSTKAPWTLDTL